MILVGIEMGRLPHELEEMTVEEFTELLAAFKIRGDEQEKRLREAERGR